jgi:hypothetical protein
MSYLIGCFAARLHHNHFYTKIFVYPTDVLVPGASRLSYGQSKGSKEDGDVVLVKNIER